MQISERWPGGSSAWQIWTQKGSRRNGRSPVRRCWPAWQRARRASCWASRQTIGLAMTAMLAGGHILLQDVPGVGKTMLARALARLLGGQFQRIQFTSDLLPADVTGGSGLGCQERGICVPGRADHGEYRAR